MQRCSSHSREAIRYDDGDKYMISVSVAVAEWVVTCTLFVFNVPHSVRYHSMWLGFQRTFTHTQDTTHSRLTVGILCFSIQLATARHRYECLAIEMKWCDVMCNHLVMNEYFQKKSRSMELLGQYYIVSGWRLVDEWNGIGAQRERDHINQNHPIYRRLEHFNKLWRMIRFSKLKFDSMAVEWCAWLWLWACVVRVFGKLLCNDARRACSGNSL